MEKAHPISLTGKAYYQQFIYSIDYVSQAKLIDASSLKDHDLSALKKHGIPTRKLFAYYPGSADTGYIDFRGLVFVIQQADEYQWQLVALGNLENTI